MRCIVYVSRVIRRPNGSAVPHGLYKISQEASKRNKAEGITGVLAYEGGHFLQVIEGPDKAVGDLFESIRRDDRHQDVQVLIDAPAPGRAFTGWSIKVLAQVGVDREFEEFAMQYYRQLSEMPEDRQKLLQIFYCLERAAPVDVSEFKNAQLSLTSWPDFTKMRPSPAVIDLCCRMTLEPVAYADIRDDNQFKSELALVQALNEFKKHHLLQVHSRMRSVIPFRRSSAAGEGRIARGLKKLSGLTA